MGTLWDHLQAIPTTHETVSKAKIEELLTQNLQQLDGECSRHKSTVEKHDNDFADIAFSDPSAWQLHGFVREHSQSDQEFHIMSTGYDHVDISKYHGYKHIHAHYAYRVMYIVTTMYKLSPQLYWFAPFDLVSSMKDKLKDEHQSKSWELEVAAYDFMRFAEWTKPDRKDWEFLKQGQVTTNRKLHTFRAFLTALLPYVEKPLEFDIKLSDMLLIGTDD